MRNLIFMILLATTGASIIISSACSPNSSVQIKNVPLTKFAKALQECTGPGQQGGQEHRAEAKSIMTCEVKVDDPDEPLLDGEKAEERVDAAEGAPRLAVTRDATKPQAGSKASEPAPTYQWLKRTLSYALVNNQGSPTIKLQVGFGVSQKVGSKNVTDLRTLVYAQCIPDLNHIWAKSGLKVAVVFKPTEELKATDTRDQYLFFKVVDKRDARHPGYRVGQWPDRALLYPNGRVEDEAACLKQPGDVKSCISTALRAVNEPFCLALANKIHEWVGLENPDNQSEACQHAAAATSATTPEDATLESTAASAGSLTSNLQNSESSFEQQVAQDDSAEPGREQNMSSRSILDYEAMQSAAVAGVARGPRPRVPARPTNPPPVDVDPDAPKGPNKFTTRPLSDSRWETTRMARKDLKTVLTPVCPHFSNLSEDSFDKR